MEILVACMESCEGMKFALLNGNGDVLERSTYAQISFLESNSTISLSSIGSNLSITTEGIWIVNVHVLFVNMTVKACIWDP